MKWGWKRKRDRIGKESRTGIAVERGEGSGEGGWKRNRKGMRR
jgi:hypothetical protein